ncbi:MAG: DUF5677 domain-containing protein [Saprospiraceae bacterium]
MEQHCNLFLPASSWQYSRIELLHIAIALQNSEPEQIIFDLKKLKKRFTKFGIDWKGNLSTIFLLAKEQPEIVTDFKNTVFDAPFKFLFITYNQFFDIKVPKGNLLAHTYVYKAYIDTNERKKDISILCKFVIIKLLEKNDPSELLLNEKREEILIPEKASSITAMWLIVDQTHNVVDTSFGEFIWQYNYYKLPFLTKPSDLKREIKNFKKSKLNEFKHKLSVHFEEFKKIDLLSFFDVYVAEVIMGFVSRQQYLFEKVIEQEERHEGEIAESTLRLLYENRLKLLWLITKQDIETIKQYKEYRVGRENLFVEHYKSQIENFKGLEEYYNILKNQLHNMMMQEGIEEHSLGIEKGDAFERNIKDMADDIGGNEPMFYFTIYKRTSDIIHGNWRAIEKYHLERSINPAHDGLLRYTSEKNKFAGLLPSYYALMLSTDLLINFFQIHPQILKENKKLNNSLARIYKVLSINYVKEFMPQA